MNRSCVNHVTTDQKGIPNAAGSHAASVNSHNKSVNDDWMQETTQRIIKLLGLLLPDLLVKKCSYQTSLRVCKTKLIARLVLRQKGKIYWPIFQLAELVFFRASTKYKKNNGSKI